MPFAAPEADLLPTRGTSTTMFGDVIPGGSVLAPRQAKDLGDALIAGLQNSATGMAMRGKLPSMQLGEDAPWYHRLAAGVANVGLDLPLSAAGLVGGAAAGTAAAGPAGTVVGGAAGAFAAPMALREALITAYNQNAAMSWSGAMDIAWSGIKGGTKGAVIGGVTGGAGGLVGKGMIGASTLARGTAQAGAELAALTATSAAVEQHMPAWQDFMDNAILLGGLKAAPAVAKSMRNVWAATGKSPEVVLGDAVQNPAIKAELMGVPGESVYHGTKDKFVGAPDLSRAGEVSGIKNEPAFWVTSSEKSAADFAEMAGGKEVMPFKLNGNVRTVEYGVSDLTSGAFEKIKTDEIARGVADGVDAVKFKLRDPNNALGIADEIAVLKPSALRHAGDETNIPAAYAPLALEERIKAAIDADPRPDMIRQQLSATEPAKVDTESLAKDPVKYEYITDNETAKGVLRNVTELYQNEITQQTRGVVPNKETAIAGLKLISDGVIGKHLAGDSGNAAEIYARAHLLKGATNEAVAQLAKIAHIPEAELSPAMKLQALASLERVSMLKSEIEGVGAEAGRALQIFRAIKQDPSLLGDADVLLKAAERKGSLQDVAKLVETLKDPAQVARFAKGYTSATFTEKLLEVWKAGILSGPQTHLANIFGNATKWLVEIPENVISASLTALDRAAKGDPMKVAQWKARAFSQVYGLQHGAREALTVAAEVAKGAGDHLEKGDVYRTAIEGTKGEIIRLPFKALQVEDALFRTVAERGKAYIMATDRAIAEGLHPDSREFQEAVVKYTERPELGLSEKDGLAAIKAVQDAGAESVFAQRLGPRLETIQRAMAGHWSQLILPFVRTPANLVSWTIQHTPVLNLASGRWMADFKAGGELRNKALARIAVGTGLAAGAYAMAQDGGLTGGGLFDKSDSGTKSAAGWQPYSIKIGDKYYSYQRIEPVAKVLGLAADLVELERNSKDEQDKGKIAAMMVLMFGNATISTTYLSGVSNTMNAVLDPDRYGANFLEQYASSVVPKIVGQTTAMVDPYKREIDGTMDAIQSQIPFLREKLLPKRDVWGEPQKSERLFGVMPVASSAESHDEVRTEAMRLSVAIQDAPKYVDERGPLDQKQQRIKLDSEQRDIFKEVAGKNAMSILSGIVNAPDWSSIPDFAKAAIYQEVIKGTRKQGQYAALPPDAESRQKVREKIVNEIIRQTQNLDSKAMHFNAEGQRQ